MENWIRRGVVSALIVISFALIMFGNVVKIKGKQTDLVMYDRSIKEQKKTIESIWVGTSKERRLYYAESINHHSFSWNDVDKVFVDYDEWMVFNGRETIAVVGRILRGITIAIVLLSLFMILTNRWLGPLLYSGMNVVLLIYCVIMSRRLGDFIRGWIDSIEIHIWVTAEVIISLILAILASVAWFALKGMDKALPKRKYAARTGRTHQSSSRSLSEVKIAPSSMRGYAARSIQQRDTRSSADEKVCENCGNILRKNALFCPQCGMKYEQPKKMAEPDPYEMGQNESGQTGTVRFCPQCGAELDSDALFCGECGYRIS